MFSFFLELSVLDLTDMIFFIGADWVNPEDPNVIAENELLGAAASIEAQENWPNLNHVQDLRLVIHNEQCYRHYRFVVQSSSC